MPSQSPNYSNNLSNIGNSSSSSDNDATPTPESLNFTGVTTKRINESYQIISKIGEGISGSVFKAYKKGTNEMVALKNFKGWNENDRASKEECSLLLQLRHIPYVTPIIDIYTNLETSEQVVVFPYFEHDLSGLLSEHRLSIPQVKCYFKQLLEGIYEIHLNGVMHRDIKAANILVNNKGSLFIGDLGTATSYTKRSSFSSRVVTLWYRAPELLLGATQYGPEIDMWSIGCVLIELATSRNFLPGNSEQQQMEVIAKLCGTPTEEVWEGVSQLPNYQSLIGSQLPVYTSKLRSVFKNFQNDFVELLEGLLTLNPKKRLTAAQALASPFFTNLPLPFKLENMPGYSPIHVLEAVQKRLQQSEKQKQQQLEEQQRDREQKEREQQLLRQREQRELKEREQRENDSLLKRKQKEKLDELLKQSEEIARKQQEILNQKIFDELKKQEFEKNQKEQQISSGRANLKRSLEIVNDIRNYCTSEVDDSECDCDDCCDDRLDDDDDINIHSPNNRRVIVEGRRIPHGVEVVEVVEVEDGFFTDDELDQDDSDDSDSEDNSQTFHFNFTPIKSLLNNNGQSKSKNDNPFLQPPKKQRTTTSSPTFTNLSTPLIIH